MKKTRNVLGILGIVFGILSLLVFGVSAFLPNFLKFESNVASKVPLVEMVINVKDLLNPKSFNFNVLTFVEIDWIKLVVLFFVLIVLLFNIVWLILIIKRRKLRDLVFIILGFISSLVSLFVILVQLCSKFTLVEAGPGVFSYNFAKNPGTNDWMFLMILLESFKSAPVLLDPISKVSAIIYLVTLLMAFIAFMINLFTIALSIRQLKLSANRKSAKELIMEEEANGNEAKLIRRILVHKSGKVVKVVDEDFNDLTAKESKHYQSVIDSQSKKHN